MARPVLTPLDGDGIIDTAALVDDAVTQAKIADASGGVTGGVNYRRLGNMVTLWTGVSGFSSATVPAGYRPAAEVKVPGADGDALVKLVNITTGGVVTRDPASGDVFFTVTYAAA